MSARVLAVYLVLAYAAMTPMFALRRVESLDFWWWMSANGLVLSALGLALDRGLRREMADDLSRGWSAKIAGGLISAVALVGVFAVGQVVLRGVWPAAEGWIARVYELREGASTWRIGMLLTFMIGPAEEIVWRGVVQRGLVARLGPSAGITAAVAVYAGLHLATGNPVLWLAAAVAGAAWGWMYHRWRSLAANIVSHAVWDVTVFVLAPFD